MATTPYLPGKNVELVQQDDIQKLTNGCGNLLDQMRKRFLNKEHKTEQENQEEIIALLMVEFDEIYAKERAEEAKNQAFKKIKK